MKIALYSRQLKETDVAFVQQMVQLLNANKVEYVVCEMLKQHPVFSNAVGWYSTHQDLIAHNTELLFSLGGDGTLLDTISLIQNSNLPVLGINSGRLGFLTSVNKENFESALKEVLAGGYLLDKRFLLQLDSNKNIFAENNFALNEFTIHKKDAQSMIVIHTYLNGEFLTSYWADGLIVSTPTGSTAYNLSCGGPILVPSSDSFVITPVAPHNLNIRPLVVPGNSVVSFEVEGRSDQFLCTLDSRVESIEADCQLAVRKSNFTLNLVRLNDSHFLTTISKKLNWGLDERN
jgi:NAD+ kinase